MTTFLICSKRTFFSDLQRELQRTSKNAAERMSEATKQISKIFKSHINSPRGVILPCIVSKERSNEQKRDSQSSALNFFPLIFFCFSAIRNYSQIGDSISPDSPDFGRLSAFLLFRSWINDSFDMNELRAVEPRNSRHLFADKTVFSFLSFRAAIHSADVDKSVSWMKTLMGHKNA